MQFEWHHLRLFLRRLMDNGIKLRLDIMDQIIVTSEKQKMLRGELYNPLDPELTLDRQNARFLLQAYNNTRPDQLAERDRLIRELISNSGQEVWIEPPFYCDYGSNITLGHKVYMNFNCTILDIMPVTIGDHVFLGPAVQIYTATHPLNAIERRQGLESGKAITIGDDVWIGGGAILCPGVTIGAGTVIGAGSVVTKDIPTGVIAVGNPCQVLRAVS
jgi:maltose O-acetyltransferase